MNKKGQLTVLAPPILITIFFIFLGIILLLNVGAGGAFRLFIGRIPGYIWVILILILFWRFAKR